MGTVLILDFEKAQDKVNWDLLDEVIPMKDTLIDDKGGLQDVQMSFVVIVNVAVNPSFMCREG